VAAVNVRISVALRRLVQWKPVVTAEGATVGEALADLERRYPGLGDRIATGEGAVRSYVNVFVNGEHIRYLHGIDTPLVDGAEITILPAAAGG